MNRLSRMARDEYLMFQSTKDRAHLRQAVILDSIRMAVRCCQDPLVTTRGTHDCWNGGEKNLKDGRYTYSDPIWREYMDSKSIWSFEAWRLYGRKNDA